MRFFTTVKLGPNRELTKEGFTLFRNVAISRIGEQIYGPGEVDIPPGEDGLVHITRNPEEVFRTETLDSCNGKSLVINHPVDDVTPDNWQHLTNGVMFNAQRGTGEMSDHSVADILVTTHYGLSEIDNGTREVSLGYDADYFQTGEGRGEQRNIVVNHVALVEAGRCGASCAIRDHKYPTGEPHMKSWKERVLDAIRNKDEEGAKKALEEVKDEEKEHEKDCNCKDCKARDKKSKDAEKEEESEKRMKKMEDSIERLHDAIKAKDEGKKNEEIKGGDKAKDAEKEKEEEEKKKTDDDESELEEEAPEGAGDKARKARDSAYLVDSFETVKMVAEIIAPGVKIPTFDKAADPKKTFKDCVCGLRRKALQQATNDTSTAAIIDQVRGKTTDSAAFSTMSCAAVRAIFNSVGALKKAQNNAAVTRDAGPSNGSTKDNLTPAEKFAAASAKRWGIGTKK